MHYMTAALLLVEGAHGDCAVEEVARDGADVARALAERGDAQRHDVEPVEEIEAEGLVLDGLAQGDGRAPTRPGLRASTHVL